jgi:hypothetical protein
VKFTINVRPKLFSLAVVTSFTSIAVLIGSYARHVQATDYLKQADEDLPWGSASALVGFVLSFFGDRLPRIAAVTVASLLVVYWYLIGLSLH